MSKASELLEMVESISIDEGKATSYVKKKAKAAGRLARMKAGSSVRKAKAVAKDPKARKQLKKAVGKAVKSAAKDHLRKLAGM